MHFCNSCRLTFAKRIKDCNLKISYIKNNGTNKITVFLKYNKSAVYNKI